MDNMEILRTLQPFSDLKTPTDTIYDHLPYRKDINLVKESDVKQVSGNVIKYTRLIPEEGILIDSNPLMNRLIKLSIEETKQSSFSDYIDGEAVERDETEVSESSLSSVGLSSDEVPVPDTKEISFSDVDEEDDDYSFLSE